MSLRRMRGWAPRQMTYQLPGGRTETHTEPELDWVDVAIFQAWWQLNRDLCGLCGRPLAMHEHDKISDYTVGARTCTATEALDAAQAKQAEADEADRKQGRDPDRARTWLAWTDAEGAPAH